jgi:hypothetical protein
LDFTPAILDETLALDDRKSTDLDAYAVSTWSGMAAIWLCRGVARTRRFPKHVASRYGAARQELFTADVSAK